MEFKSNVNPDCCTPTGKYELCGCSQGIPYVQLTVVGGGTVQTAWLNTETGDTFTTKPAGFVTGTCSDAAAADVLKFSADAPTASAPFSSPKDGNTTIQTSDGTAAGDVVGVFLYDAESATWTPIPLPSEDTLVGLTPALTEGTLVATFTTLGGEEIEVFAPDPVAMINDDQVLTGAANTNVALSFTPTTVPDPENPDVNQVNYVIGASAKIDGVTIVENPTTKVLSAVPPAGCCVPPGGTDGQVLTKQPDGSFAWETPAEVGTTEVADGTTITGDGTTAEPFEVANPVPTGGTEGQVLSVNSSGALVWVTPEEAPAAPVHASEVQLATAAQDEFTLTDTPIGAVKVTRNGVDVTSSFSFVGAVGTYTPADNYDCVFDADDKVQFHYETAA